ncbi:Chitinase domain-containing protein 1 [Hordeum vulgare]|nr:Chitinase domain-containing protein 1 [Hordeum vulgare]
MNSNSNPNPFPWGMGWRAFFLGCSLRDRVKFKDTMDMCSNFTSMAEVHKDADNVVKKATAKELKTLIPDPAKGVMSVNILHWAMNQDNPYGAR